MVQILFQHWPEISSFIISLGALIVSVKAWHRNRAIYNIETEVIRQPTGKLEDLYASTENISNKLSSGDYTILTILERSKSDKDWEIFLGRIKPERKK